MFYSRNFISLFARIVDHYRRQLKGNIFRSQTIGAQLQFWIHHQTVDLLNRPLVQIVILVLGRYGTGTSC